MLIISAMWLCALVALQQSISCLALNERRNAFRLLNCIPGIQCGCVLSIWGILSLLAENGLITANRFSEIHRFVSCVQLPLLRSTTTLLLIFNCCRLLHIALRQFGIHRQIAKPEFPSQKTSSYNKTMRGIQIFSLVFLFFCLGAGGPSSFSLIFNYFEGL